MKKTKKKTHLPERLAALPRLGLVLDDRRRQRLALNKRLEAVKKGKVAERVVDRLVEKHFDRRDAAVAEAGGERSAQLGELDVVEPVLEPALGGGGEERGRVVRVGAQHSARAARAPSSLHTRSPFSPAPGR